jgi:AraC-like DNA-binding protein
MELDQLRTLIDQHAPAGISEPLPGVLLCREVAPVAPEACTTGTTFALITQGSKQLRLGSQTVTYGPGEYLVTSIDLPVIGRFTEATPEAPALGIGLDITASAIAELLLSTGEDLTPEGGRATGGRTAGRTGAAGPAAPALATSRAPAELMDAVGRLLRLLDRPRDLPVLAPMVRREILWLLITGPQGDTVRQLGLADSKLTHINRVVQWIHANPAEPIRVEELARRAGLSVSAFHRTFKAVTGSSPLQFQKQLRLVLARQLLVAEDISVTRAAFTVGYECAAQFNREYRRLFGAPPGRDRASAAA